MAEQFIRPMFVESAPAQLADGVLYISDRFHTALHKCCCGCGREVVTPLNPAGWRYIREGQAITLKPSIGNWSFPCKSHYLIIRNRVVWAATMSAREIAHVKARDARDQAAYIARTNEEKRQQNDRATEATLWSWILQQVAALRRWWSS